MLQGTGHDSSSDPLSAAADHAVNERDPCDMERTLNMSLSRLAGALCSLLVMSTSSAADRHNVLDSSEGTLGHCESLIAADTSVCASQYDAFQSSEGLCDFACGFCAPPPPPPESRTCWVQDNLDVQPPAEWGSCSELINSGLYSCDEHFHGAGAGAGSHVGQCNLACEEHSLMR